MRQFILARSSLTSGLLLVLALSACGGAPSGSPTPAVTSLSPPPGLFNGEVTVTLSTDRPASIFVTTDGSDPQVDGPARRTGDSTLQLTLEQTTILTFFSRTPGGAAEAVRTAEYVRAGGPPGTASGVVVVGTVAANHPVSVVVGSRRVDLGTSAAGEVPFTVSGLESGTHSLTAWADLNEDTLLVPLIDLDSQPIEISLDLADPTRASAEGLRLYLGAPSPERCIIQGQLTVPKPEAGDLVRIVAVEPADLAGGAGLAALLGEEGAQIMLQPPTTVYPFALTDLAPATYVAVPALTSGTFGAGFTLFANPLASVTCTAGQVAQTTLAFGALTISGTVTLQPTTPPSGLVYGAVAARSFALTGSVQAALVPVAFLPQQDGTFVGPYVQRALRGSSNFALRVFTNIESQQPLADALTWLGNPFAGGANANVVLLNADVQQDITITLP